MQYTLPVSMVGYTPKFSLQWRKTIKKNGKEHHGGGYGNARKTGVIHTSLSIQEG